MQVVQVLAWVFTVLLLVLVLVSFLAARGAIPLNHWAGIRIAPVMRDEAAWRAGHAAAVVPAIVAFVVSLVCALLGLGYPVADWGCVVAFVGGVIWVMTRAARAANATGDRTA